MNNNRPRHIAIIMDGNGRWAEGQGQQRLVGHHHGVDAVRSVVRRASDLGVEYLTIYAFSTENWGRPQSEVDGIMELLATTIMAEARALCDNGVQIRFIGDTAALPDNLQLSIAKAAHCKPDKVKLNLVIALNYSARWELTRAVKNIAQRVASGQMSVEQIDERTVANNLTTNDIPDPDLLIRTSGEQRLSNFLLWQLSYSELYFTDTLWPDFDGDSLSLAIDEYECRQRRFGVI